MNGTAVTCCILCPSVGMYKCCTCGCPFHVIRVPHPSQYLYPATVLVFNENDITGYWNSEFIMGKKM